MPKKTVICVKCGKMFEVEEGDMSTHYVCTGCKLSIFRGVKK